MEPLLLAWYLVPALCLVGGALVILLVDLILLRPRLTSELVGWLAVASVVLAVALSFVSEPRALLVACPECSATLRPSVTILAVLTYDAFTAFVWRLILVSLGLILLISRAYVRRLGLEPGLFYASLLLFGFGAMVLAATSNIVMLLLAVDFVSIVGYLLTGFLHNDRRSTEGAIKYLVYGSVLSATMAFGLSWLYGLTGTADYASVAQALVSRDVASTAWLPMLAFILAGFAFKIGAAPFHQWAPDALEGAPTPAAAALAVVSKVAGVAALVRLTTVMLPAHLELGLWWRWPMVAVLAIIAMCVGNLGGMWQTGMKRLIAYSGIAQVGYALTCVALANQRSMSALLVYLTAYALAELGVFTAIVVVAAHEARIVPDMAWSGGEEGAGTIADYRGLYHRSPVLAVLLIVSVLSLFGMPGTGGFIGKLGLLSALLEARRVGLLVLTALNTVVSMVYYWRIVRVTFVETDHEAPSVPVPLVTLAVAGLVLLVVLAIGIYPAPLVRWAETAALSLFEGWL